MKPKVGVVADERLLVGQVIHSVEQHVDRDVDIGSLLLSAKDVDDARAVEEWHPVGVGHELAEMKVHPTGRLQSSEVRALPPRSKRICRPARAR